MQLKKLFVSLEYFLSCYLYKYGTYLQEMNNIESKPLQYKDLPSFFKQKLWNNKTLTFTISRDKVGDEHVEITLIKNERNYIKSFK